jgi:energy-coupling factor transport system ATP-binding protein
MGIHLQKVSYHYTKSQIKDGINDIDLDIQSGDFLCICGATGSGKSTLISHLNALLLPNRGCVLVDDYKLPAKRSFDINLIRKKVGMSFQFPEYQLFASTVLNDVMFGPINFKYKKEVASSMALSALKLLNIENLKDQSPLELSGGQMRKVAIAGVLSSNCDYIVLDEPTRGLDPKASKEILDIFMKLNQEEHKTIIAVTHDMDFVSLYASRVIVLKEGNKVFDGTKEELFSLDNFNTLGLDYPTTIKITKFLGISSSFNTHDSLSQEKLTKFLKGEDNE